MNNPYPYAAFSDQPNIVVTENESTLQASTAGGIPTWAKILLGLFGTVIVVVIIILVVRSRSTSATTSTGTGATATNQGTTGSTGSAPSATGTTAPGSGGTPTPITPTAPPKLVTVYTDCDYKGDSGTFGSGNYTLPDLISHGIPNDTASSIRIPSGCSVTLYQDDNFQGRSKVLLADTSCFTNLPMPTSAVQAGFIPLSFVTWNDQLSSMKVQCS